MEILQGKQAGNLEEAAALAFREAGIDDMGADIIGMFSVIADADGISSKADKLIGSAIRSRYGGKATWHTERWYIPIPDLRYDARDLPRLTIEVRLYLVAVAQVRAGSDSCLITLVGIVDTPETLIIPMVFLHAVREEDLARFAIVARDAKWTTWEVGGAKPVHLPSDFISELTAIFRRKSVVTWLLEFGEQGSYVATLVMGNLFGLAFQGSTKPVPVSEQLMNIDDLVSGLESMAYKPTEAREMVRYASPYLRADMTLEEGLRITLQVAQRGQTE
ncbi:MAG: hypothetical protein V1932_04750 [Chloroflexota bacterium]